MNFQKLNLTDLKLIINNAETKETKQIKAYCEPNYG